MEAIPFRILNYDPTQAKYTLISEVFACRQRIAWGPEKKYVLL